MARSLCKIIQRHVYDILTNKYTTFASTFLLILLFLSVLHFGEVLLEWSRNKCGAFSVFNDNIMGNSFQEQLSQYLPIDVVYTWVNGSDPEFIAQLQKYHSPGKKPFVCPVQKCIESHLVIVYPSFSEELNLDQLRSLSHIFAKVTDMYSVQSHVGTLWVSILVMPSIESAAEVVQFGHVIVDGAGYVLNHGLLTTDWTAKDTILLTDVVLVTGIEASISMYAFMEAVSINIRQKISSVVLKHSPDGYAIVTLKDTSSIESFLSIEANFAFFGSQTRISIANLILGLKPDDDVSRSRFEDNEELRYSLRSLEKFAPWIRHVYIVSNGQLPYWLDVDNPRVSIITHKDLFSNISHLPTFSSSAIECHLHKIPNLSQKFLYLNDDVFFGANVWPDDFYTKAKGQKVYLAWSVPNCKDGCPSTWIGDGFCDNSCNNSQCHWDGGDCNSVSSSKSPLHVPNLKEYFWESLEKQYCHLQCANMWIADKYCDVACDTRECGFDGGDCGIANYSQLHEIVLKADNLHYTIPDGIAVVYCNLTNLLKSESDLVEATYDDPRNTVRTMALNLKYYVLTIIFYINKKSTIRVNIVGKSERAAFKFSLNISANTALMSTLTTQTTTRLNLSLPGRNAQFFKENDAKNLSQSELSTGRAVKDVVNKKKDFVSWMEIPDKSSNDSAGENDVRFGWRRQLLSSNTVKSGKIHWKKSSRMESQSDTFADSLRHVNQLLNEKYGLESRKVPAHMPHMFDVKIMEMLQDKFSAEFVATSSRKFRHANDMQMAFAYFYFLMSEKKDFSVNWLFKKFDADHSGTLADRELRTLIADIFELPLSYSTVQGFQDLIINCFQNFSAQNHIEVPLNEHYLDSGMPLVTKELIMNCKPVLEIVLSKYSERRKFPFELISESEVTFKMINTNLSQVIRDLDDVRKHPRKFVCLNDNIDHNHRDAEMIKAIVVDFFESILPLRSQFELPPAFRNKFLHVYDLNEWRENQRFLRNTIFVLILLLIVIVYSSVIHHKILKICRILWTVSKGSSAAFTSKYKILKV